MQSRHSHIEMYHFPVRKRSKTSWMIDQHEVLHSAADILGDTKSGYATTYCVSLNCTEIRVNR